MVACNFHVLGNSRKYLYHITESFLEFEEQGSWGGGGGGGRSGVFELEIERYGGMVTIGIPKVWGGGLDLEFLQETDKSVLHKTLIFWT